MDPGVAPKGGSMVKPSENMLHLHLGNLDGPILDRTRRRVGEVWPSPQVLVSPHCTWIQES